MPRLKDRPPSLLQDLHSQGKAFHPEILDELLPVGRVSAPLPRIGQGCPGLYVLISRELSGTVRLALGLALRRVLSLLLSGSFLRDQPSRNLEVMGTLLSPELARPLRLKDGLPFRDLLGAA